MPLCPICNLRKAKRSCPALGRQICTVCCGTKRIVEINCPADCGYLASSRTHPPAVVQRQQEMDRAMLLPLLQGLSERQARVFLMLAAVTARHQGDVLQKLGDEDIEQAAGALAATLETSSRGIVYEHRPASLAAARLMGELKGLVEDAAKNTGSAVERDAAIALRRIEHAAKMMVQARPAFAPTSDASTFALRGATPDKPARRAESELQQMFKRVLAPSAAAGEQTESPAAQASSLIIP